MSVETHLMSVRHITPLAPCTLYSPVCLDVGGGHRINLQIFRRGPLVLGCQNVHQPRAMSVQINSDKPALTLKKVLGILKSV